MNPAGSAGQTIDAVALLNAGREHSRAGRANEAIACLDAAILAAERCEQPDVLAESLRQLAIVRHRQSDAATARALVERSYEVAHAAKLVTLSADALNTLGVQQLLNGTLASARETFMRALAVGGADRDLCARVEQNLGILANMQGDLDAALLHYGRSLDAYTSIGNEHGCALAYHNLGMVSADRGDVNEAERFFNASHTIAERVGDASLRGLCLVSHAELDASRQRFDMARARAEEALALFDRLGQKRGKADAYRVIGMVYRETGRLALAEWRLTSALDLAVAAKAALIEAETSREIALLYQAMGRNEAALRMLNRAHLLFQRLQARIDAGNVSARIRTLEATYLSVVRAWSESMEASDGTTYGHCARVARRAAAMSRAMNLDRYTETALLLGAYLHDLGMVRVPHELLHRSEPLTPEETRLIEMHPVWGEELLGDIEFPWPIKPIVRSHHERCDGGGYPDKLTGDRIPLLAQVVGILDTYEGMTAGRFGRTPLAPDEAVWRIVERRAHWTPLVLDAFLTITR